MIDLNDNTIREAWKWLPHGEHCTALSIAYENANVTDEHRMAALAGVRWLMDWGNEQCGEHGDFLYGHESYQRYECPQCFKEMKVVLGL